MSGLAVGPPWLNMFVTSERRPPEPGSLHALAPPVTLKPDRVYVVVFFSLFSSSSKGVLLSSLFRSEGDYHC